MEEIIIYLLKSSGLIAAFFLSYYFLLRKETFFTSNRWFLIAGLITSLLLPLFFIKKIVFVESPKIVANDILLLSNQSIISNTTQQQVESIDWLQLMLFGYSLVVLFLIIKVVINVISLFRLLQNKKIQKYNNFAFVDLQEDIAPFSFFNFIVYNSSLYSHDELQSILLHEKVHSQQKHSFDVLIAKLFCIVFWFNPFVWLYKKAIVQNLEYIADNKAIQQIEDKKVYQKALLKVVSHQNCLPITNHFNQSLIKKRIVMLNKNQSHKRNSWKYVVVIPSLIGFILLFQIKTIAQEKLVKINNQIIEEHIGADITFDATESDKSLSTLKNVFYQEKIIVDISKVKRNSANEIVGIQIKMKCEDGRKKELKITQNKPIDFILIYTTSTKNGSFDFGVKHITKNEIKAIRNKIDMTTGFADDKTVIDDVKTEVVEMKKVNTENLEDIEQAKRNIELSKLDIEQAKRDLEQSKLDIKQSKKDIEQAKLDIEQSKKDLEQSKRDIEQSKIETKKKLVIFSNDNGDDIVFIPSENSLKVPGYPSVQLKNNPPILVVNGVEKLNPLETLNQMDLQKVKSIRVYDQSGKETTGSQIKKITITTK